MGQVHTTATFCAPQQQRRSPQCIESVRRFLHRFVPQVCRWCGTNGCSTTPQQDKETKKVQHYQYHGHFKRCHQSSCTTGTRRTPIFTSACPQSSQRVVRITFVCGRAGKQCIYWVKTSSSRHPTPRTQHQDQNHETTRTARRRRDHTIVAQQQSGTESSPELVERSGHSRGRRWTCTHITVLFVAR